MNGYICTKACNIGGVAYKKGDAIPFNAVLPNRERALIKQGYITHASNAFTGPINDSKEVIYINIPINTKDGVIELPMKPVDIITAVKILQLNADDAAKAVSNVENEETLVLIDTLDQRKTVKTIIADRVALLKGVKEGQGEA